MIIQPDEVRNVVIRVFKECGAVITDPNQVKETIFVEGGKCMARSYRGGGMLAMWMIGPGLIQFYDAHGEMIRTLSFTAKSTGFDEQRIAA